MKLAIRSDMVLSHVKRQTIKIQSKYDNSD